MAFIAAQRNQPEIALEYLSRAAWQWPERRLIAESIGIAMANQEYQQAVDLAQLLETLEPDDYLITLSVAKAKFRLGEIESGLDLLADLTRRCNQKSWLYFPGYCLIAHLRRECCLVRPIPEVGRNPV